ncbi:CMGC/DYRK/YAK protein kinase Ppk15 [Schizosaccharomyces japonicus yFS275]|uniref:CMGC/DYRK/YAK protein kinase Ppk15 n=1 Tax=Schizosaccharomyces japonicus (strain yFS275 / FY16936) TaxID=402676 RepID=B6K8A1_SCHJY|nr:CMGC/DYRK/YAK protein kinase Ppk15 [Schizosaccharomyces japonicus yFS275]EEB09755.1 CMGC/DYRK/YAK protein kinase Ppk15 [Schizosaccharomyces japonicus yFS275]
MSKNSPILPSWNKSDASKLLKEQHDLLSVPQNKSTSHIRHISYPGNATAQAVAPPKQRVMRRVNPLGGYLSPLECATIHLAETYRICNPNFQFSSNQNPRRPLTKPSEGVYNHGYDNKDSDYILYVNDVLGIDEGRKYLVLDILGKGTFGQVVKCQDLKTQRIVAIKVIKNKPAFYNQCIMEVSILELLNTKWDPDDTKHILRLYDQFMHKNHLCLIFELLNVNLYELIKQNHFRGLHLNLVRSFASQLLTCASVLKQARIIHCDLKPENILLEDLSSPKIKVIDFGSACHERQTVYTYIQSRFYRSPEVILGLHYNCSIDIWSIGCILAELFLGLPLFPGNSEYNQLTRIIDMLGYPPQWMLEMGKNTRKYFNCELANGKKVYQLKSLSQFSRENDTNEQPGKQYFREKTLEDLIMNYSRRKGQQLSPEEEEERMCFIDFLKGFLNLNQLKRWTPDQAKQHPFITQESFMNYYMKRHGSYVAPPTRVQRTRSHTIGNQSMVPPTLQRANAYVTPDPANVPHTLPQYIPPPSDSGESDSKPNSDSTQT